MADLGGVVGSGVATREIFPAHMADWGVFSAFLANGVPLIMLGDIPSLGVATLVVTDDAARHVIFSSSVALFSAGLLVGETCLGIVGVRRGEIGLIARRSCESVVRCGFGKIHLWPIQNHNMLGCGCSSHLLENPSAGLQV